MLRGSGIVDPDPRAAREGNFRIAFEREAVSPTAVEGTFRASGVVDDHGTYTETLASSAPLERLPSVSGTKTLQGANGTIMIAFYAGLSRVDANRMRATGGFNVVGNGGSYTGLEGSGKIDLVVAANATPADLTKVLEGIAQYAR